MFPKNRMMLSMAYFKIRTAHQRDENKDNDWTTARNICLCFGRYDSPGAHCSYLDIYISQNIRLCKGDFEGKFQTILQAKGINFFIWKFRFIILIFLLVFAEFVKFTAFYTMLLLLQRVYMFELRFELAFKITLTKPDILWDVNVQIATVCIRT